MFEPRRYGSDPHAMDAAMLRIAGDGEESPPERHVLKVAILRLDGSPQDDRGGSSIHSPGRTQVESCARDK